MQFGIRELHVNVDAPTRKGTFRSLWPIDKHMIWGAGLGKSA